MMDFNIYLKKYLLNSQKQVRDKILEPSEFQLVYPIFIQTFGLQGLVTGDFNKDMHTIANVLATKVYMDLYDISKFDSSIPYSFITLITFFSHMYVDLDDAEDYSIGLYKKFPNVFIVSSPSANEGILNELKNKKISYDAPLVKLYADDFYPGFTFISEEEQNQLSASSDDSYTFLVTITTDSFITYKDSLGSYVFVPCLLPKIQSYLYTKYSQIYEEFSVICESIKTELDKFDEKEKRPRISSELIFTPYELKQRDFVWHKSILHYLRELVDFFSPHQ